MATPKFNPRKLGLKRDLQGHRLVSYSLYERSKEGAKKIGWIMKCNDPKAGYWVGYAVVHYSDGGKPSSRFVFQGQIPNNTFAKQLFKNIF